MKYLLHSQTHPLLGPLRYISAGLSGCLFLIGGYLLRQELEVIPEIFMVPAFNFKI